MQNKKLSRAVFLLAVSLLIILGMSAGVLAGEIHTREDTPSDFNAFLASCSITEKLSLLGALGEKAPGSHSDYDSAIRKGLVYRAYNKTSYLFRNDKEVDYHGIVMWAAEDLEVEGNVKLLSTFELERKILGKIAEHSGTDTSSILATVARSGAVAAMSSFVTPLPTLNLLWKMVAPNVKDVTTFIMAVNLIKTEKYGER